MRRAALVTGASRGLGATLAAFLAAQDHDLVLAARAREPLESTAAALKHYGGRVVAVAGDLADPAHRRDLARMAAGLGRLDLLVNNASELGPSPLPTLDRFPLDELRRLLEVNLLAPLALTQALLPLLEESGGMVVNLSSDAARGGYPGWGGYGASKAALDLLSLTLANELRERGVAVASVDPGDMRTRMHQAAYPGEDISDRPTPEVTVPFWGWLLGRDPLAVSGGRYAAQGERWEAVGEEVPA